MTRLAEIFKALSDESRLRIINLLLHSGELCVCDIQSALGCTQTKISRHLSYLKRAGLVKDRRQGLWMIYSIAKPADRELRSTMESLAGLLRENSVSQRDARRLRASIRDGCCAAINIARKVHVHPIPPTTMSNKVSHD